jgi:hypothetical protein
MAVVNTHPILTGLLAQQQGTHQGAPGGLGNPLDANERAILLKHASQFKPVTFLECCSVAPDHIDAHENMAKHIGKLASRLIVSKYYLKELEQVAMDWIQDQFSGRAASLAACGARGCAHGYYVWHWPQQRAVSGPP